MQYLTKKTEILIVSLLNNILQNHITNNLGCFNNVPIICFKNHYKKYIWGGILYFPLLSNWFIGFGVKALLAGCTINMKSDSDSSGGMTT